MKKITNYTLLTILLLMNAVIYAQPGSGTGGGALEGNDPTPPAPINTQIILLFISALIFVFYTFKTKKDKA
jgi:hypothetical protein